MAGFVFPLAAILEFKMSDHPLKALIEAADRSISAKDFDGLMRFYADDATLVVKAGMCAKGKDQIRKAFSSGL